MAAKEKAATAQEPTKKEESLYINRELSWLSFNERVLLEAADTTVPLLERLKFLMIYQSNLEEFYRVRIGILTHRAILTPDKRDPVSGMMAEETIQEVLRITREQLSLMESVWKAVRSELKRNGVEVLNFNKISKVDELMSKKLFGDIKNLLFPKIIDPNQALPFFWGSAVVKVTRNADVFLSQMAGKEDLREKTSTMLSKRKRETPVRAKIYGKLTDPARSMLIKKLHVPEQRVFQATVPFDLSFRSCIGSHEHFRYEERKPAREIGLKKGEYFRYIEKHDLLMSFPFQSMMPFVDLIYEAADDPEVLSIKITLYRMSASSKIAAALAYAADRGKDVLCLLELRARFDEQNNIDYSEMLEDAGCRIIYGLPEHKVHSKLCLITRQHGGNIETITQVGTGNYNEITGEQYTDLSLITADPEAGKDAEATFQALLGGELPPEAHTLWIAPLSFKSRVLEYLDREISKGTDGRVAIKCNAMNNPEIMEKLIECSQAGVQVELFIRGICCLRPGIPGKTDNITVRSVVGRWLEHSRVYCFGEGEDEKLFIGSGDLLNRNLERRVEAFVEIRTPDTREQIHEILNALREDREKSRTMQPDGSYIREPDGEGSSSQERLYQYFSKRRVSLDEESDASVMSVPAVSIPVKPVVRQWTIEAETVQKPVSTWEKIKKLFG